MRLTAAGLTFFRQGRPIVRDVDLTLTPGRLLVVAGPNGVGKTTLIRLLLGLLPPNAGHVRINDRELTDISRPELARAIAYVPQSGLPPFPLTVFEAVLLGRRPHLAWRPTAADLEHCAMALCRLGLDDLSGRDLGAISGGQLQKVLLARALAQETPCLILDEPTSSLDLRHQLEVLELLRDLARQEGKAVLASLHDINLARRFADEVLLLAPGRVHGFGDPETVLSVEALRQVYGVDVCCLQGNGLTGLFPIGPSDEGERRIR